MPESKTILLIVPEFPPNGSIGGRRWAKFSKYLVRLGYTLKVIAFKPENSSSKENWMSDIKHEKIEVFYLPSRYPKILISSSRNILSRIFKKIVYHLIRFVDGGIIEDKGIFFRKAMTAKAKELIAKYSIRNIICSGPSHRVCYYTTLLKEEYPELNVIVDFRDRWTDGQVYGLINVSGRAFKKESAMQRYVCQKADYIISTYSEYLDELKNEYKDLPESKFFHITHSFDPDDYKSFKSLPAQGYQQGKKIKFIYGGTVNTAALNDSILPFFDALTRLKANNLPLYSKLQIVIYSDNFLLHNHLRQFALQDIVSVFPQVSEDEFYSKVAQNDFLLMFLGEKWKNLITTKNITYLPFKRPIVLISNEGLVSRMIEKNKLGFVLSPTDCYDKMINLLEFYMDGRLEFNEEFDLEKYSYIHATEKLTKLIN